MDKKTIEKETPVRNVIVLNRMYAGDYLSANIGHEVINLFKADNGCHYLYLNATGDFAKEHANKIGYMFLTKYHTEGVVEIIGLATGLEDVYVPQTRNKDKVYVIDKEILGKQQEFCKNEKNGGVTYGGVSIFDIFTSGQQSIYITFKADKLLKPKERIFFQFPQAEQANADQNCIIDIKGPELALSSLKQYFKPPKDKSTKDKDYDTLANLINKHSLWEEWPDTETRIDISNIKDRQNPISLFDICQIQENELCFSNALAYFMRQKEFFPIWNLFFQKNGIPLSNEGFSVNREESAKINDKKYKKPSGGYIDIVVRDAKNIVVIENKIKSDINKKESDTKDNTTQLDRYYNYITWRTGKDGDSDKGKTAHFFILVPNYNIPSNDELNENYTIITYKVLYDFLKKYNDLFANDQNFIAFFDAIKRHTYSTSADYLFNDMKERFFKRILEQRK